MDVFYENEALAEGIKRTAMDGVDREIVSSDERVIWGIEADTKVDDTDLSFPVIVHMRGSLSSDAFAILRDKRVPA